MKAKILILGILFAFATGNILPQNNLSKTGAIETASAEAINFLLTCPKTANEMNSTQEAALTTLRTVLQIFGQRKHEVNVANVGKDQIIINSNDGRQVTVVMDTQGNMYLLQNGVIYPIAQSLVNQAKNETPISANSYATLQPYDLNTLQNEFLGLCKMTTLKKIITFNWYKDFNGDGLMDFSEYENIKRTFRVREQISVSFSWAVWDYEGDLSLTVQIFNDINGTIIVKEGINEHYRLKKSQDVRVCVQSLRDYLPIGEYLPAGKYVIIVTMKIPPEGISSIATTMLKEYFEIIE